VIVSGTGCGIEGVIARSCIGGGDVDVKFWHERKLCPFSFFAA